MSLYIQPANTIATRSGVISTSGTLLAANSNRRGLIIQNLGTNPLYVALGAGASAVVFDFILKGGAVANDGTGGFFSTDVLSYTGIVTVFGTAVSCTGTDI